MKQYSSHEIVHVIFLGPPAVGKSCLLNGFTSLYQSGDYVQFYDKQYQIDGKIVKFLLWDIPSSLTLQDSTMQYCKKGQIVACVYSANHKNTFNQCQIMIDMLIKQNKLRYDAKFALISNKNDLQKMVLPKQGSQMAYILNGNNTNNNIANNFFQVSAKNNSATLEQLCKGFYQILKDKNIKNIAEMQQSEDPAPPQSICPKVVADAHETTNTVNKNNSNSHVCKVVILGDHETGKTSITKRFINSTFSSEYQMTIGVDFAIKQLQILGKTIKLQIWDPSNILKFTQTTTHKKYLSETKYFLLVYDCSKISSFINLPTFIQIINNNNPIFNQQSIFIIANKIDQQHQVSIQKGKQFAQEMNYEFYPISAKQNIGISQLFYHISDLFINSLVANSPKTLS